MNKCKLQHLLTIYNNPGITKHKPTLNQQKHEIQQTKRQSKTNLRTLINIQTTIEQ